MGLGINRINRAFWAVFSPWVMIGAVVILVPVFVVITMENISKQKEYTTRLLVEKGAALIRSFEAGARTGIGMQWSSFQLQKLLIETAQQPDIDHLIVTDIRGTILADSDPSMIGENYGTDLNLASIAGSKKIEWRQVKNPEGADTFEIFRQFSPTGERFAGFQAHGKTGSTSAGYIIFVGMDMSPVLAAREQDAHHTIWMMGIFFLIGFSGVVSLFLASNYRSAKTALSHMKAFSGSVVENMPIGLVATNARGEVMSFNQTAEAILGRRSLPVIGKPVLDILPRHLAELLQSLKTEKKVLEQEMDCSIDDGTTVPLEVIATTLEGERGDFLGYVMLFRDITEIQSLKREIAKNQRLASLGNLAAGVAHEIRNPLSSIKGFATFFKERYRGNPEDEKTAEIMIQEVDRLNRVISQLLEFARPIDITRQWTSVHALIQHTLKMIDGKIRMKGMVVHTDLSPSIEEVMIDPDKITQVLLNLFLNAVEAMDQGGVLSIALSRHHEGMIRIDVSDTGSGMDQERLAHIFDPYFTTKAAGTGLGLAIVHKIVEAHDGEIRVESVKGKGTRFSVYLPMD